ncbi:hypothetical protein MAR_022881 [Mya arenaria]|uniref:Uncharacterized protein n=1 Tax=Mya arenaria TaxID=6604 RepID=A0ABY7DMY6_MYAAR|nr:hypothetical protein MAR_022881 [Mya arenaria]
MENVLTYVPQGGKETIVLVPTNGLDRTVALLAIVEIILTATSLVVYAPPSEYVRTAGKTTNVI